MDKIDNAIESAYRALAENLSKDNILLYSEVPDPKLQIVFSTLHTTINWTCERMNERLPTGNSTAHFWAEESRQQSEVHPAGGEQRTAAVHVPQRELLGQRAPRELLRAHEGRAGQ